jgi:hypothetical protein
MLLLSYRTKFALEKSKNFAAKGVLQGRAAKGLIVRWQSGYCGRLPYS